jgi:hypothetical protein
MALAGWVYQPPENARKISFSSGGNVAEKTVEVKAGKSSSFTGNRCAIKAQHAQISFHLAGRLLELAPRRDRLRR